MGLTTRCGSPGPSHDSSGSSWAPSARSTCPGSKRSTRSGSPEDPVAVITEPPEPAIPVTTADDCQLVLRHHPGPSGQSVLLLHGASAGSDTFRIGERQPLVDYLLQEGFDVWTLDWRASMNCARQIYCRNRETLFTIDAAAAHDVPAAITTMRRQGVEGKIALVAHCMGGGIVAQGIAVGAISAADVENVVFTALGLFYKSAPDDVLKAEDQSLE